MIGKCEYCGTLFGEHEKSCERCGAPLPLSAWARTPQFVHVPQLPGYQPPPSYQGYTVWNDYNHTATIGGVSWGGSVSNAYCGTIAAGGSGGYGLVNWR